MINKPDQENTSANRTVSKILIAQPKPTGSRSPYFDIAEKYGVDISFHPFIKIEPIHAKDFRKQKIDINAYTAIIFTSRNAIDHFFRIIEELRITISQEQKYFCITEAVALYLQKFILYRKRKVFYSADGSTKSFFDVLSKYKSQEKFLYPCSETFDSEITSWLTSHYCEFATPVIYHVVSNDLKNIPVDEFDIICLFTPGGVRSLFENYPTYTCRNTAIATHGDNTTKAAVDLNCPPQIQVPSPGAPTMASALEKYLRQHNTVS